MRVSVKLFAFARQAASCDSLSVEIPERATVGQLRETICRQHPALADVMHHAMFAVNTEYASDERMLAESDEIACIPPVSGG